MRAKDGKLACSVCDRLEKEYLGLVYKSYFYCSKKSCQRELNELIRADNKREYLAMTIVWRDQLDLMSNPLGIEPSECV